MKLHASHLAFLLAAAPALHAQAPAGPPALGPDALGAVLDVTPGEPSPAAFANFETPHVAPIAIATLGSGPAAHDWLLVCNTPDNSVEIYDASPPFDFVARVGVGLGPATVRWSPQLSSFFTCNFDGDSVSRVRLELVGGVPVASLQRTDRVGDEPADVAFTSGGAVAVVSLSGTSRLAFRSATDLTALVLADVVPEVPNPNVPGSTLVTKAPRQLELRADGRFVALNFFGGITHASMPAARRCDFDLWWLDPLADPAPQRVAGLGTINQAFAFNAAGDRLFVVGTLGGHLDAKGVAAVSELPTGFTRSCLWVVDATQGLAPLVQPFAQAGLVGGPLLQSVDLNQDLAQPGLVPVAPALGLSQPSAVLVRESAAGPHGVGQVVVAFQHSDKVAFLEPSAAAPGGWTIARLAIPLPGSPNGYSIAGPSGLAQSATAADPATPGQPGLVYVANRFSDSVAVVNPHTKTLVAHFALHQDPTPAFVNRGREFLYGAQHSGNGFVACASCHVQGRTDGMAWDLGNQPAGPAIPPAFVDGNNWNLAANPLFPEQKGPLVTQTLQGLLNHPVQAKSRFLFTNAPYHWRGDKAGFTDFNEAFHELQGKPDIGTPGDPRGVTEEEMRAFESFVFSILVPPNPEQPLGRVPTGALGVDPNDPFTASGGRRGLQLFFNQPSVDVRSCFDCHNLPDGSTNSSTLAFNVARTLTGGPAQKHPFESSSLRNLRQREAVLHDDFGFSATRFVRDTGLLHAGVPNFLGIDFSINTFVHTNFGPMMPGAGALQQQMTADVVEITRSLDSGTAPVVGFAYTLTPSIPGQDAVVLAFLEGQVREGNAGLAAYARSGGAERGYWFDVTADPPAWREEGTATLLSRAALAALVQGADDVVVVQATPLLEERRIASLDGTPAPLPLPARAPRDVVLEPMAPGTFYADATKFTGNLHWPDPPAGTTMWSLRHLQHAVVGPSYGVPAMRHEPPRRFRVTGAGIRPGARLGLVVPTWLPAPADPYHVLELDLVPTAHEIGGRQVWESVQELDAHLQMAFLNGGPFRPEVQHVLERDPLADPGQLDPALYNSYLPVVWNTGAPFLPAGASWQTLRVQAGR